MNTIDDSWIAVTNNDNFQFIFKYYHFKLYCFIPCNTIDEKFIGWFDYKANEVYFIDEKNKCLNSWLPSLITHFKEVSNF